MLLPLNTSVARGCNVAAHNLKSDNVCTMTTTTGTRKDGFFFFNIGFNEGNALGILFENDLFGFRRLACPEHYCFIIIYSYFWRWRSLICFFSGRSINGSERQRDTSLLNIFVINSLQFQDLPIFAPRFSADASFITPECFVS